MKTRIDCKLEVSTSGEKELVVRVNGQRVYTTQNLYIAEEFSKALCKTMEIVGVDYEGKPL
jgi:hypothetical protein